MSAQTIDLTPAPASPGTPGPVSRRFPVRTLSNAITYVAVPVVLVVVWQLASSAGWVSKNVLASPVDVFDQFVDRMADGSLPESILISLRRVFLGSVLGIAIGTALGLVAGLTATGRRLLDGPMHMLQAMPFPALIPLLMIWLGIDEGLKVGLVAIGVLFPVYLNLSKGIRSIDPRFAELTVTRNLSRWQTLREIVAPGALAPFLVGLRFALAIAWLCLVFGETIAANSGIGYMMMQAKIFNQTSVIILGLVIYAVLGLLVDAAVHVLERLLLPWRREYAA